MQQALLLRSLLRQCRSRGANASVSMDDVAREVTSLQQQLHVREAGRQARGSGSKASAAGGEHEHGADADAGSGSGNSGSRAGGKPSGGLVAGASGSDSLQGQSQGAGRMAIEVVDDALGRETGTASAAAGGT